MTRKRSKSLASGFAEVEPGEGGEAPMTATVSDTGTYDVLPEAEEYEYGSATVGATTGIQNLQLEVDMLSAVAVDRVAEEIARRVAAAASVANLRGVTVASPSLIAFLRLHSSLEAEVSSLEAMAERLAAGARAGQPSVDMSTATALAAPVIAAAATAVPAIVNKASRVLKTFAATTGYSGRSNRVRQVLLDAALAKHLSLNKLEVEVPERSLQGNEPRGLIARILKLQARCRELQQGDESGTDYGPIVTSVDALVSALFGVGDTRAAGVPIAQQLMLADGVARGIGKGKALLFAEIVFSGGSYRTRRWIFNFLFGKDGLTYNGGAGVTYFLFRADQRTTLDSDTIYFASPHGRFRDDSAAELRATNISGSGR